MKICLPTNTDLGLQSELAENFSAAHWLQIVESDTMETLDVVDATDDSQRSEPVVMDLIVCRGMLEGLYQSLRAQGVPILGTRATSVAGAIIDYRDGNLHDLAAVECCKGTDPNCDSDHLENDPDRLEP